MSIVTEIERIQIAKEDIKNAITEKGGVIEEGSTIDTYSEVIQGLSTGGGSGEDFFVQTPTKDSKPTQWIKSIHLIDFSHFTTMGSTFSGYKFLETIPLLDTSNVTSMYRTFYDCYLLKNVPNLNTSKVTSFKETFYNCRSLTEGPQFDTSKATTMYKMFDECPVLKTLPEYDCSSCTDITDAVYKAPNLVNFGGFKDLGKAYPTSASANTTKYTLHLHKCTKLTHDSLMNVINGLYDIASKGVATQTLYLGDTNKAKLTEDEMAIATNKGWTIS